MKTTPIIFTTQSAGYSPADVETEYGEFFLYFSCPICGEENGDVMGGAWRRAARSYGCSCGHVLTCRIHKEDKDEDYSIQILAMAEDPDGFVPMISYSSLLGKRTVFLEAHLAQVEVIVRPPELKDLPYHKMLLQLSKTEKGNYIYMVQKNSYDQQAIERLDEHFTVYQTAKDLAEKVLPLKAQVQALSILDDSGQFSFSPEWFLVEKAAKRDAELAEAIKTLTTNP